MKTLKLCELDCHIVKICVASVFAEMLEGDEELLEQYTPFMTRFMQTLEQEQKEASIAEYVAQRDMSIETFHNLLKQLNK